MTDHGHQTPPFTEWRTWPVLDENEIFDAFAAQSPKHFLVRAPIAKLRIRPYLLTGAEPLVIRYAMDMLAGDIFPPIWVELYPSWGKLLPTWRLLEGNHRSAASLLIGHETILAEPSFSGVHWLIEHTGASEAPL